MGKIIIFAAPSGSGKSTIKDALIGDYKNLKFSISATSRAPRGEEKDGVEYYFMSNEAFMNSVDNGEFIEWEEVYKGSCYGTLKSEVERIWSDGNTVIFDIDVKGAANIKNIYGDNAAAIFIMPPSIEALRERLENRKTDTAEAIERRIARATEEISCRDKFDYVVVNDNLESAIEECRTIINNFLNS
ncbi:MAG: guanylate kinase [Rikenellaceae bacterium]